MDTVFHAIVDGTTGNTTLQPVQAKLLSSIISASGSVMKVKEAQGHHIRLDVAIEKARIEDLLVLGVKTAPPIMTGAVRLKTKLDLPPGEADVPMRLRLTGTFAISGAHFTNPKVQAKVDNLSMRSQGKPKLAKDDIPDNVPSDMSGKFQLRKGVLSFSQLYFQAPGTLVSLKGDYSLDGNRFDFRGKARLKAKLSHFGDGMEILVAKTC
ncbi:MAG TPA: AsmA-like C-terminal region-containing protein [Candidatus Angelobacter sp.]|nr:AsmA-like C-terminal region-containing protein [Candidatus Angelobacter sp.]